MKMEEVSIQTDEEETIYAKKEEQSIFSYFELITEFIQNNGWYVLAFIIFLVYLIHKLWPRYIKWSERRAEDSYEAEIKKNPDLYKQKQEELQKARVKFQVEYERKAKIALEKQKEKEKKILEEKQALLNNGSTGHILNKTDKPNNFKPDYNPLMGSSRGSNYRPPRRSPCSGGGCG